MTSLARSLKPAASPAQLVVVVGVSVVLIRSSSPPQRFLVLLRPRRRHPRGCAGASARLLPAGEVRRARVARRRAFPELEIDLVTTMPAHAPTAGARARRSLLSTTSPWVREDHGVPVENDETPHLVLALDGGWRNATGR